MKKIFLILFVFASAFEIQAQTFFSIENNFIKENDIPNAKSLIVKSYVIENNNKKLCESKRLEYDLNNKIKSVKYVSEGYFDNILYIYDNKGRLSEEKMYRSNKVVRSTQYEYNKLNKKVYCESKNTSGDVDMETNFEYDEKGNLIKEETISSGKKFGCKYVYDKNSKIIEMVSYNLTKIEKKFYYRYDEKGLLVEEKGVFYWAGNEKAKYNDYSRKIFIYSEKNKLSEVNYYITDQLYEKYLYYYNETDQLLKWEKYNVNAKLCFSLEYEYE